jgi:hypothetical protein
MKLHEIIIVKLLCLESHLIIDVSAVEQVDALELELVEVVQGLKLLNSLPLAVAS